jgi:hypothetical protein
MDVVQDKEFILHEDPFHEKEKEVEFTVYIMRLLTWGLNTRIFMEHPDRLSNYETKNWGTPMTDEEREELWNMNWKKTVKKETKSLSELMKEQQNESNSHKTVIAKQQQDIEKQRLEQEARAARRSKWSEKTTSEDLDWRKFRK